MFTEERIGEILRQLSNLRYSDILPLDGWKMLRAQGEVRPETVPEDARWQPVPENGIWGGHCEYYIFQNEFSLPPAYKGKCAEFSLTTGREGEWDATNPQFTVYIDRILRQGFDVNHHEIPISESGTEGEAHQIFLSAYTGVQNFHLEFNATLRAVDRELEEAYYDLLVPWQVACLLDQSSTQYIRLITVLNEAVNLLDLRCVAGETFRASLREMKEFLRKRFYSEVSDNGPQVICIGHTHIDVAWLWTLSVTEDKAVRSFSTVLELMRRYPEYRFMSSQAQLYLYVKKNAPEIYEQIRQRVAEGRWEVEGSMFVEPDCNLSSGESLVRQLLYGKKFFRNDFGRETEILWLPDVFGYSAALPQILKKSGVNYFMTTKISWNEVNKIPYDTFYWKGIDGTKILSHFICTRDYVSKTRDLRTNNEHTSPFTTNYNGYINPCQIKGAWQRYQQKELNDQVLSSFGYGDGGGGPTAEMLETQRRLAYGIPGCPRTQMGTALGFFRKLEEDITGKHTPIWSGELYLEYHRATYTGVAKNKRNNRKSEFALGNLETWAVAARELLGEKYPKDILDDSWEVLLRNQFHDILPGSAIREVYEDSDREYATLFSAVLPETDSRLQHIADLVGGTVVFNPNGQTMSGWFTADEKEGLTEYQQTADGKYLAWADAVPAKGWKRLGNTAAPGGNFSVSTQEIKTPFACIRFNGKGQIFSWVDLQEDRELLQSGMCANVLMSYEDKPHIFDNWNLFDYYKEKCWPVEELVSAEVTETGPFRCAVRFEWKYLNSTITETVYAYSNSPKVDFEFSADWQERQLFLKALFPVSLNANEATYEIQYGNVKRPTVYNTSWDQARFEVCCHKWMDISEYGYGISFLNDCKYGVSIEENVAGISLIKSGLYPDPEADKGEHHAVYSMLPHRGSWQEAGVVQEAYLLNNPLQAYRGENNCICLPDDFSLISCCEKNIMVEAVKAAEERDTTICRFYDFENCSTKAHIRFSRKYSRIWLCDMQENRLELIAGDTNLIELTVAPFEIITIELE